MQSTNDAIKNSSRISGGKRSSEGKRSSGGKRSHTDDVFARVDKLYSSTLELKYENAKLTKYIEDTTPRLLEYGKDECDGVVEYAIDECDTVQLLSKCIDIGDIFETWNMDNVEGDSDSDEELFRDLGDEFPNWNLL